MSDTDNTYELCDYERKRLERIRKNEAYLESLGLKNTKTKLLEMTQTTKRNQQRAKARKKSAAVIPGDERRSSRNKQDKDGKDTGLLMLSYADPDDMSSPSTVKQGAYYEDPAPKPQTWTPTFSDSGRSAGRPSPSFRSTTSRINLSNLYKDFVLTQQEKYILANNTMDSNYLQKFEEFLVYHNKISPSNVRNVMRQVTKLATGQGVRYESAQYGWKLPHQIFQKNVPVTPLSDFVELMELSRDAEDRWGRDHGNGWLLSHPLKKMLLFQQFCLHNPDFLSSNCRLNEYYAEHNYADDNDQDDTDDTDVKEEDEEAEEAEEDMERNCDSENTSNSPDNDKKKRGRPRKEPSPQPNSRVAKEFGDDVYVGTVQKYNARSKYWFVVYDDGDEEELDAKEIGMALKLFHKYNHNNENTAKPSPKKRGRPRKKSKH